VSLVRVHFLINMPSRLSERRFVSFLLSRFSIQMSTVERFSEIQRFSLLSRLKSDWKLSRPLPVHSVPRSKLA